MLGIQEAKPDKKQTLNFYTISTNFQLSRLLPLLAKNADEPAVEIKAENRKIYRRLLKLSSKPQINW